MSPPQAPEFPVQAPEFRLQAAEFPVQARVSPVQAVEFRFRDTLPRRLGARVPGPCLMLKGDQLMAARCVDDGGVHPRMLKVEPVR
ncbi:hypothetical protein Atai01_09900 [Amycolatopsis taiwanensis]|uniref:Uncharacterized protein n=1 Tax=Amycolatopsis taiwanensis TaxID=342230 RepID=A0A9W6VFC3_9PSEU|nr:hypothetical protein Atai01_09900 [Amycolatopsis taiwanensis]